MGVRGEIFSTRVLLQNRTYFFNVKENRMGDLYLNIVESKNRDAGGFERQSVILFAEDLQDFLKGFDESLHVLEKAEREKRRSSAGEKGSRRSEARDGARPESGTGTRGGTGNRAEAGTGKPGRARREGGNSAEHSGGGKAPVKRGRRMVVKKSGKSAKPDK
jgi:hypothetical protein